jgi:hypothetical protein
MFKAITALLLVCPFVLAQEVIVSDQPENRAFTKIFSYTAGVLQYICTARSLQTQNQITVTTISNANPGAVTATAHGFYYSASGITAKAVVFISGASGGWTGINGTHVVTPTSANAFTIDVDTTTFGAWGSQSIVMTTKAPLVTKNIWSVKSFVSDATGAPVMISYRADSSATRLSDLGSGSTSMNAPCSAPGSFQ